MALGTAKKLQRVADLAEELYGRLTQLREQLEETQRTVDDSNERLRAIERELAAQRTVIDAVADELGLDVGVEDGVDGGTTVPVETDAGVKGSGSE